MSRRRPATFARIRGSTLTPERAHFVRLQVQNLPEVGHLLTGLGAGFLGVHLNAHPGELLHHCCCLVLHFCLGPSQQQNVVHVPDGDDLPLCHPTFQGKGQFVAPPRGHRPTKRHGLDLVRLPLGLESHPPRQLGVHSKVVKPAFQVQGQSPREGRIGRTSRTVAHVSQQK